MTRELQSVEVLDWNSPLDENAISRLSEILPEHVASRRWYRSKTRSISKIDVEDVLALEGIQAYLLILRISHADGAGDRYVLPVSVGQADLEELEETVLRLTCPSGERRTLYSALGDERFRRALLNAVVCESKIEGRNGVLVASRTAALDEKCQPDALPLIESFVSRAEQSNTSIIYRDRYILKLFRKLESGVNPDVEIGRFLTERGFKHTPAVLGSLEYRPKGEGGVHGTGILQQFVANKGDAWKYTLESLEQFFRKALAGGHEPPVRSSEHPLELMNEKVPAELRSFIGPYLESAALLGQRTAEMHAALTAPNGGPDFAPQPFTREDGHKLYEDCLGQADIAFEALRRKQAVLTGPVAESVRQVLSIEHKVADRFAAVQKQQISTLQIRHHGDYHLGQVLYTGEDFMIIDFEGEPARSLAERRAKALALRDVAGMVRSFQYAAFAALFGQVPGVPTEGEAVQAVEAWADAWNAAVSATYLKGYFQQASSLPFVPADDGERRVLLDAFLLQKALYEVAYELNNRPDWLQIPLLGILSLVS